MLSIKEPEFRWGVASWATDVTGRLYTEDFFTFRKDAEAYIEKTKAFFASEGKTTADDDMFPVLLKVVTSICADEETVAYANEQAEWLEEHGQAAKRRRAEQTHNAEVSGGASRRPG